MLIGLADLRYTEKHVLGLFDLINALSGKFFTSVLALGSGVLFVLAERFFLAANSSGSILVFVGALTMSFLVLGKSES